MQFKNGAKLPPKPFFVGDFDASSSSEAAATPVGRKYWSVMAPINAAATR